MQLQFAYLNRAIGKFHVIRPQRKDIAFPLFLLRKLQKYCVPGGGLARQNAKERQCISYIFAKEVTEILCPGGVDWRQREKGGEGSGL